MDAVASKVESTPQEGTARPAKVAARSAKRPFMILGAIAIAVLLGVGIYLLVNAGKESTDDAQVDADVVPLAPRVAGQVLHVSVQDNQRVKRGDTLMQLDDADYSARADQAQAELETALAQAEAADAQAQVTEAGAKGGFSSARAAVSGSSAAVANADAQIAAAKASLLRAKADAQKADTDLKRAKELRDANAVPQQTLDNAQTNADAAHAAVDQAVAQLAAAEEAKRAAVTRVAEAEGRFQASQPINAQIAAAQAQASLAHARVKSAQAQLTLAKLQLSYTRLIAPEDGVVSKLSAHEGQLLSVGQPVAELVPDRVYVTANFKETQIGGMHTGDKAVVTVDAFGGRHFEGDVESLSGGTGARFSLLPPDNASGNFVKVVQRVPVRIRLNHVPAGVDLRAGLSAEVTVYLK